MMTIPIIVFFLAMAVTLVCGVLIGRSSRAVTVIHEHRHSGEIKWREADDEGEEWKKE